MPPSHLRPLSFADILDGSFTIYRRHFATLFTTALLPLIPVALFWAAFGALARGGTPEEVDRVTSLATLVSYPLLLLATIVIWGALIHECSQAVTGGEVDRREAYRVAMRRFFPLLGSMVLALFLTALGLLALVVGAFLVVIILFALWQVVVIEGKGPVEALGRSRELARGAWGRIALVLLVVGLIVSIPGMATGTLAVLYLIFTLAGSGGAEFTGVLPIWLTAVTNVLNTLLSALTIPFMVAAMTLLYYDRRVRTDALDLELAAESLPAGI